LSTAAAGFEVTAWEEVGQWGEIVEGDGGGGSEEEGEGFERLVLGAQEEEEDGGEVWVRLKVRTAPREREAMTL
jgi:hypothetical protein